MLRARGKQQQQQQPHCDVPARCTSSLVKATSATMKSYLFCYHHMTQLLRRHTGPGNRGSCNGHISIVLATARHPAGPQSCREASRVAPAKDRLIHGAAGNSVCQSWRACCSGCPCSGLGGTLVLLSRLNWLPYTVTNLFRCLVTPSGVHYAQLATTPKCQCRGASVAMTLWSTVH